MNRVLGFFMLCSMIIVNQVAAIAAIDKSQIQISAKYETGLNGQINLKLSLTNLSPQTVELLRAELPWENYRNIDLVLLEKLTRTQLKQRVYIEDSVLPGSVFLKSGETLTGQVDLGLYFPKLGNALESGAVLVFWHCEISSIELNRKVEFGGRITIPKMLVTAKR